MKMSFFLLFFSLCTLFAEPVIIIDTNRWSGHFDPLKIGFTQYTNGNWRQTGANAKIVGFNFGWWISENFAPEIAAAGENQAEYSFNMVTTSEGTFFFSKERHHQFYDFKGENVFVR